MVATDSLNLEQMARELTMCRRPKNKKINKHDILSDIRRIQENTQSYVESTHVDDFFYRIARAEPQSEMDSNALVTRVVFF